MDGKDVTILILVALIALMVGYWAGMKKGMLAGYVVSEPPQYGGVQLPHDAVIVC